LRLQREDDDNSSAIPVAIAMMRCMLDSIPKVITYLSWDFDLNGMALLPCYWNTNLTGNLARVLDWLLVALPVLLGMALRSSAVAIARFGIGLCLRFSLSFTLSISNMATITSMSASNNLRVVTNDCRAVVYLGMSGVALSGECFLTLLDVGCVHNSLADRAGNLTLILYWPLVALPVLLVVALRPSGVSRLSLTLAIPIPSMAMSNYLGVMANNSRTVVHLLRCFLAVGGDDVLALLNISSVDDNIVLLMTLLALGLNRLLVALLVWLAKALKIVVSVTRFSFSLSFTLTISNMSMRNNLRVMTNNSRAVVDLLRCFLAVLGDNVLTLLHISSVHHNIILLMASLVIVGLAGSV